MVQADESGAQLGESTIYTGESMGPWRVRIEHSAPGAGGAMEGPSGTGGAAALPALEGRNSLGCRSVCTSWHGRAGTFPRKGCSRSK